LYLDVGLLGTKIEDMSEINDFLNGKILTMGEETQKQILDYLSSEKRRFGLGEMLDLQISHSRKPL
jgi:hypothetical protein